VERIIRCYEGYVLVLLGKRKLLNSKAIVTCPEGYKYQLPLITPGKPSPSFAPLYYTILSRVPSYHTFETDHVLHSKRLSIPHSLHLYDTNTAKKDEDTSQTWPRLRHSPSLKGISQLATDGVYRSFSSTGEVVDYKQMSPAEITKMLEWFGKYVDSKTSEEAKKKFHGVDGRNVTDLEQLLHPGQELCRAELNKDRTNSPASLCLSRP